MGSERKPPAKPDPSELGPAGGILDAKAPPPFAPPRGGLVGWEKAGEPAR